MSCWLETRACGGLLGGGQGVGGPSRGRESKGREWEGGSRGWIRVLVCCFYVEWELLTCKDFASDERNSSCGWGFAAAQSGGWSRVAALEWGGCGGAPGGVVSRRPLGARRPLVWWPPTPHLALKLLCTTWQHSYVAFQPQVDPSGAAFWGMGGCQVSNFARMILGCPGIDVQSLIFGNFGGAPMP